MPRFNLARIQLENLTDWLREENDDRRSPLYILETLVFSDIHSDTTGIYDRTGHYHSGRKPHFI